MILGGCYRDRIHASDGTLMSDSGWRHNTIALSAWPVVAGLLRNDPRVRGIQYCAVGRGRPDWDRGASRPDASIVGLLDEVARIAIPVDGVNYLDGMGRPVDLPTSRIEAGVEFSWSEPQVLREFGLVGGDARAERGTGRLINYVSHVSLTVPAGGRLSRRIRLSLRPDPGVRGGAIASRTALPDHPLGNRAAVELDGVGPQVGKALETAGLRTIREVALAPMGAAAGRSALQIAELRARARLALRAATELPRLSPLAERRLGDLIRQTPTGLARETGLTVEILEELFEQLGTLHLCLDARRLQRLTLQELAP